VIAKLAVEGLAVFAGTRRLLGPLSLAVPSGGILTIMGETGAGKSLLAQAVLGDLPPPLHAQGVVTLDGRRIDTLDAHARSQIWGRQMAMLPQEPWRALSPLMPVGRQVSEVYRYVGDCSQACAHKAALSDLATLGLAGAERLRVGQLSGGMAQRASFAAARAGEASLLIADEPTKGIDQVRSDVIVDLLIGVPRDGGALLVITHDVAVARRLRGDVMLLKDGALVEEGPAEQVLSHPTSTYGRALLAADPAAWPRSTAGLACAADEDPVLHATGLTVARGSRRLFSGLDLQVQRGERLAVTGPSSVGKTSLLDTLAGLIEPLQGKVVRAPEVGPFGVQKLYQDPPAAFPSMLSLGRNLRDVARRHNVAWSVVTDLLERLRVAPELLERRPDAVSGGELQRIALARALAIAPRVLLADEPTSRLDAITQADTMQLIAEVAAEGRTAVVLVTHDLAIARNWATRSIALG